jgi:hypothetical protein
MEVFMSRAHVLSALLGSALAIGMVVLLSMNQVLPAGQHVIVSYGPSPRDMVQIKEGTPYTVPPGKLFVLTGVGSTVGCYTVTLKVNGQDEASTVFSCPSTGCSIMSAPVGFTVASGSTLETSSNTGLQVARAWGYLADQ